MKNPFTHPYPYEEMLFAHTNKNYGAFELRTDYSNQLTKSSLLVLASATILLLFFTLHKTKMEEEIHFNTPTILSDFTIPKEWEKAVLPPPPAVKPVGDMIGNQIRLTDRPIVQTPEDEPQTLHPADLIDGPSGETFTTDYHGSAEASPTGAINELPMQKAEAPAAFRIIEAPEVEASFVGGFEKMIDYFNDNNGLSAREILMSENMKKIYVEFIVGENGIIKDVQLKQSCGNSKLDREALRLVEKMPLWIPGKQGGENVNTRVILPISFAGGD